MKSHSHNREEPNIQNLNGVKKAHEQCQDKTNQDLLTGTVQHSQVQTILSN